MKVAISAQRGDIESLVDPRFGRAAWFIIADSESGEWAAIDNRETADASGGAGVQAGTTIVDQGVGCVITGNVGPNAHRVLAAASVDIYRAGNGVTVREALRSLSAGTGGGRRPYRRRALGVTLFHSTGAGRRKVMP